MQLIKIVFVALAAAAVSATPVPDTEGAQLEARQSFCSSCDGDGKKVCCSLTSCSVYSC